MSQADRDAPTMPPGPGDAAALEYVAELKRDGAERSADFWAIVMRVAPAATYPLPAVAPRRRMDDK